MTKPIYSSVHPGKHVLIIDVETTGSTFGSYEETFSRYQAISFGCIVATSDTFEEVASLSFKVRYDPRYEWSAEAEKIHGISRQTLAEEGLTNEEAAAELAEFVLNHFGTGKVMFANHNPWFDIEAMRQLLEPHGVMPDLHHVVLDTSSLGFVTMGKYRSNDVFSFFNGERPAVHDALGDARMALGVLKGIREIVNSVLAPV
jgi:DNA polymerase III epsilon subunit-like protein